MKRPKVKLLVIALTACLCYACSLQTGDNKQLMDTAAAIAEQQPDSALALLQQADPTLLDTAQHAVYILLQVQAKDKVGQDITADTAIFRVRDYFIAAKDHPKAALACYYAAKVYGANGNDSLAITIYLQALEYAGKTKDDVLSGKIQNNIGAINYNEYLYPEAIGWFRKSLQSFRQAGNEYEREGQACAHLGKAYLLTGNNDSAIHYYQAAMDIANNHSDTTLLTSTLADIGMAYYELDHYVNAKKYSLRALTMIPETDHATLGKIYMNLTMIYFDLDKNDSVSYYLDRAELLLKEVGKLDPLISFSHFLYRYEKENHNDAQALAYHEQYTRYQETAREQKNSRIILDLQRKYDIERIQNENNRQIAKRQRIINILTLSVLMVILIAGTSIYWINRARLRFKELHEQAQQDADALRAMQGNDHTTHNNLREALVQNMGIADEIASLNTLIDQGKGSKDPQVFIMRVKEMKAKYTQQKFMKAFEVISPGLPDQIKACSPDFDDKDVCICCCSILEFNNNTMAMITGMAKNSVEQRGTKIRNKLDIEKRGDIGKFLKQRLGLEDKAQE